MACPDLHLVRCAGCGHNFETRRFGELACPICRSKVWLEPPEGCVLEPEEADGPAEDAEPEAAKEVDAGPLAPPDSGTDADEPTDAAPDEEAQEAEPDPEPVPEGHAPEEPTSSDSLFEAADGLVHAAQPPPWETPGPRPVRRFVATLKQVLLRPGQFFVSLPVVGYGRAFAFGWVLNTVGIFFFAVYGLWQVDASRQAHLELLQANAELGTLGYTPEQALDIWRSFLTFCLLAAPLLGVVNLWVTAGLNHIGVLLVVGRDRRFQATFRATAYAFAPAILLILPAIGNLIGFFWVIVLQVIAIGQVHRIPLGRATLAVLLPLFSAVMLLLLPGP